MLSVWDREGRSRELASRWLEPMPHWECLPQWWLEIIRRRIGKISDAGREFQSVSYHASYVGIRISPTELQVVGQRCKKDKRGVSGIPDRGRINDPMWEHGFPGHKAVESPLGPADDSRLKLAFPITRHIDIDLSKIAFQILPAVSVARRLKRKPSGAFEFFRHK